IRLHYSLVMILALLCGSGWIILKIKTLKGFLKKDSNVLSGFSFSEIFRNRSYGEYFLAFLLVFVILTQFQYALRLPLLGFDSRAHWAFKTKILHYEGTFHSGSFYESERIHPQVRHPLLLPLSQVVVTLALGVYDDRLMKAPFALIFLSILFLYYNEMRRYYKRLWALGCSLLLATIPQLNTPSDGGVTSGYADAPLALFYLAMAIFLVRWIQMGRINDLMAALIFGLFSIYTKDDGLGCVCASVFALFISFTFMKNFNYKSRLKGMALFCGFFLLFILPGRIYSHSLSLEKGEYLESLLNPALIWRNIGLLGLILQSYKRELFLNFAHWGILWPFLILSIIINVRFFRKPEVVFIGLSAIFYLVILTVVFLVLPWNLRQFFAGSLSRLILHLAPVSSYWIALLWASGNGLSHDGVAQEGS
ncbi:hypothetical protein JW926_07480, partial [Candidatus Sumerlaeota bacterium]|nr:hypothetical protein [Candidatus Sumerlaeota bacterium]